MKLRSCRSVFAFLEVKKWENKSVFFRRIPFIEHSFDLLGPIEPGIGVFAQEPVAAHDVSFAEAIFADGLEHVLGRGGAEVAAGAGGVGEDVVVEEDHLLSQKSHWGELAPGCLGSGGLVAEAGIFAPWLHIADFSEESEG